MKNFKAFSKYHDKHIVGGRMMIVGVFVILFMLVAGSLYIIKNVLDTPFKTEIKIEKIK